jgi:hypothetical protein
MRSFFFFFFLLSTLLGLLVEPGYTKQLLFLCRQNPSTHSLTGLHREKGLCPGLYRGRGLLSVLCQGGGLLRGLVTVGPYRGFLLCKKKTSNKCLNPTSHTNSLNHPITPLVRKADIPGFFLVAFRLVGFTTPSVSVRKKKQATSV